MSRSSSVSTKDRASQGKRAKSTKQRREDSESFDVRSQYTPFFPQQQVPTWVPTPQYSSVAPQQFNVVPQNGYQTSIPQQQFGAPNQQYNPNMVNAANMQGYNSMPQVSLMLLHSLSWLLTTISHFQPRIKRDSSHIAPQSPHMALPFSPHLSLPSNGNNRMRIKRRISNLEAQ